MLRLAILRDDLTHEFDGVCARQMDTDAATAIELWRSMYAIRKICITLEEVRGILTAFAHDFVKGRRILAGTVPLEMLFGLAVSMIDEASTLVKPVRDRLGAHVRPSNSIPKGASDPTPSLLRAHGDAEIELRLDLVASERTSLHQLTNAALLFAWPDVLSVEDVRRRMDDLVAKLSSAHLAAAKAIDTLLAEFWGDLGLVTLGP